MPNCLVSGTVLDSSGSPLTGVDVLFNVQTPTVSVDPVQGSTTTAANGTWSLSLQQGLSGVFTISTAVNNLSRKVPYRFNVNIPSASTATFSSILVDS